MGLRSVKSHTMRYSTSFDSIYTVSYINTSQHKTLKLKNNCYVSSTYNLQLQYLALYIIQVVIKQPTYSYITWKWWLLSVGRRNYWKKFRVPGWNRTHDLQWSNYWWRKNSWNPASNTGKMRTSSEMRKPFFS